MADNQVESGQSDRTRLQGHNEAEAWRMVTDTWPHAGLSMTRNHDPVEHWTAVLTEASFSRPVESHGYTRYEALNRLIVAAEKERLIQEESHARAL